MREHGIEFFHQTFTFDEESIRRDVLGAHIHSAIELLYVDQGCVRFFADDREYLVNEGEMILFRSNVIHRSRGVYPGTASYYCLKLKPSLLMEMSFDKRAAEYLLPFVFSHPEAPCVWSREQLESNGVRPCFEVLCREQKKKEYGYDVVMKSNAVAILALLMRELAPLKESDSINQNVARGIYDAILKIHSEYAQNLTASDCARAVNMSYSHFSRSFQSVTGRSFREYLNQIRINRAKKALLESDKSITEIALSCGYENVSYFISLFRSSSGLTPLAYRKQRGEEK